MATAPNVYTGKPAFPVLAHSLLTPSDSRKTSPGPSSAQNESWSLKEDWERGIQYPKTGLFRCGAVIGFSRLRTRSQENGEYIGQIPRHLLVTHLRASHPSPEPAAFIIHPNSFDAFAPRTLLHDLQSPYSNNNDKPALSREDAIHRLDSVQLLPVHDFAAATQAIGQVADALHGIQARRESTVDQTESGPATKRPVLLIVVGLDTLAEGVIRASNPLRGTALLSATLRTLTQLSRVHDSCLSIILVNTNGLGPARPDYEGRRPASDLYGSPAGANAGAADGIHSIFHTTGPVLLPTLLMKTLDHGIDTHLLLSDVQEAQVVEVIKDRIGADLGKWGIWNSRPVRVTTAERRAV